MIRMIRMNSDLFHHIQATDRQWEVISTENTGSEGRSIDSAEDAPLSCSNHKAKISRSKCASFPPASPHFGFFHRSRRLVRNLAIQQPSRDHFCQTGSMIFRSYRCSMMYMCTRYLGNKVFNSEASLEDILTGHFVVDLHHHLMERIAIGRTPCNTYFRLG